jgi:hypothetical protein
MSVSNLRNLQAGLIPAKVKIDPLAKGMENSTLPGIQRQFVGVHNLHQNDGFKHTFSRIQPTTAQVKERLGESLSKLAVFDNGNGIPSAKLNVIRRKEGQHISRSQAKKNFERVKAGYDSLHRELLKVEPDGDAKQSRLAGLTNFFKKLFGKGQPTDLQFNTKVMEGDAQVPVAVQQAAADAQQPAPPLSAPAGVPGLVMPDLPQATDEAPDVKREVELTISTAETQDKAGAPITFTSNQVSSYENKSGLRKGLWIGLAATGGTLAATGIAAGVVMAAPVLATAGVIGGAIGGLYLLGKAIWGKSPWWGKTAEGQQQKELRQQARDAADEIAEMVKRQVVGDVSEHNLEAPEGGYIKKMVVDNPQMLTDFVLLARNNGSKALERKVKDFVKSAKSPLPAQIRKDAGRYWFHNLGKGDPKGHAQKTVDTVTREITRGIMQGVQEGVLQSMVADLSDDLGDKAIEELRNVGAEARFNAFQQAVQNLYPSNTDTSHHIHETQGHKTSLQDFQRRVPDALINVLETKRAILGNDNVKNYRDVLRKLDGDVQAHLASIGQIDALIHGAPSEDAAELPAQAPLGTLDHVNQGISALLTARPSPQEIQQKSSELAAEINTLRERIAADGDQGTDKLVQGHAKQFLDLLDAVQKSLDLTTTATQTLAEARENFSANPTMAQVRAHAAKLSALDQHFIDPTQANPADFTDRNLALTQGICETGRLVKVCQNLEAGAAAAQRLRENMDLGLARAGEGHLSEVLAFDFTEGLEAELQMQTGELGAWEGAGFKVPTDLGAVQPKQMEQWRAQAVGAALGLDSEQVVRFEPLLLNMSRGDHGDAIALLRDELRQPGDKNAALQLLQGNLPAPGDIPKELQDKALRSFKGLVEARMFNGTTRQCSQLVQNLHPGALVSINKYVALQSLDQQLRALHGSERGQKAYAWAAQQGIKVPSYANGYDRAVMLDLMLRFQEGQSQSNPALIEASRTVRDQLALPGSLDQPLADWAAEAGKLKDLDESNLVRVGDLITSFNSNLDQAIELDKLKAQAMARAHAQKIVPGGRSSSDPRVRQAVAQSSAPVAGGLAERLQAKAQEIRQVQQDQAALVRDRRLGAEEIGRLGEYLKNALGYKGSVDRLVQRIAEHAELRSELMVLMHANAELASLDNPPRLQHSFTREQLLAGARELGKYAAQPANYLDKLPAELRPRIIERNAFIAKFKDKSEKGKSDKDLERLLNREPRTRTYLENFLREEHAYAALKNDLQLQLPPRAVRIILEGSADPSEKATHLTQLTQSTALAEANLDKLSKSLGHSLQVQKQALSHLQQTLSEKSGGSSIYLQAQQQLLDQQLAAAAELPQAFRAPHTGALAQMGALMLQADTCRPMNQTQIELAYLNGQLQASRDALKYFDPQRFNADRPGFFGRILFSLMRKGERLNRLLGAGGDTSQAVAKAMADINKARLLEGQYQQQASTLEGKLDELVQAKNQLVADPGKVKAAFEMLASEQLAAKRGDKARLTEADIQAVTAQWKALLEGVSKDAFPEIEQWSRSLIGKGIEDLERALRPQDQQALAKELGALIQQQNEFVASHRALKAELDRIDLSKVPADKQLTLMFQAGLDLEDRVLLDRLVETGTLKDEQIEDLLNQWSDAGQATLSDPATALFLAGRAYRSLEGGTGGLSSEQPADIRQLRGKLEESFLARLGPGAPQRLESNATSKRTGELVLQLTELSGQLRAVQKFSESQLEALMRLDEGVMEQMQEHRLSQLNGQQPPRSLKALDQLGILRSELGDLYRYLGRNAKGLPASQDLEALKNKAASHSYNGALIQQELLNPKNRWIPNGVPGDTRVQFTYATQERFQKNLDRVKASHPEHFPKKDSRLNLAQAEGLDDQMLGRLDEARLDEEPDLDDSHDYYMNRNNFAAVLEPSNY